MNNEPDYDNLYFERKPMTQRIFDTDNAEDMALLWSILPDNVVRIYLEHIERFELPRCMVDFSDKSKDFFTKYIKINWHDKREITRPIQEATEADAGKLCYFWDNDGSRAYGALSDLIIDKKECVKYGCVYGKRWAHARRLTKQEIEELC